MSKKGYAGIGGLPGKILKHFDADQKKVICEDCTREPAVLEIQGETDSFGFERVALCKACHEKPAPADATMHCSVGRCQNEGLASTFVVSRDWTEGSHGPVYNWCPKCWAKHTGMTDKVSALAVSRKDEDEWDSRYDDDYEEPACFRDTDCRELDLHGYDLEHADFTGANCAGVDLHRRHMSCAKLIDADFTKVNFERADLSLTDQRDVRLMHANLTRADLSGADLTRALAIRADLSKARLQDAELRRAKLMGANLTGAALHGADLSEADLTGAVLQKAMLAEARLPEAVLAFANLTEANFVHADLRGADLRGAILEKTSFYGALLEGAIFDPGVSIIDGKVVRTHVRNDG